MDTEKSLDMRVLESACNAPDDIIRQSEEDLAILAERGRNMTPEDRLEQKRFTLYGTPTPDPETKERIDAYMKEYYNV